MIIIEGIYYFFNQLISLEFQKCINFVLIKKQHMGFWVKVGLIVIVLHLLLGFGWLIYKLSPRKKDKKDESQSD